MTSKQKNWKRFGWLLVSLLFLMNISACFHAYTFTHFSETPLEKTKQPSQLGLLGKVKVLLFGISNPKPLNKTHPNRFFETIYLQSSRKIECWYVKVDSNKGTVVIFHGFSGNKSLMLDKSEEFNKLGYSTLLIDFIGTGGSEGNETTIGYKEARDVKVCLDYLRGIGEENVILFGTSMGAAAILRAAHEFRIEPDGAILECPFGSMYKTVWCEISTDESAIFPNGGAFGFLGRSTKWFLGFFT